MNGNQAQIKISLSEQLNYLLKNKASRLGVPVTQLIKYIIIKDIEEEVPVFTASSQLEKISEKAIKEIKKSEVINNIDDFFQNL
ncbi:hypothetical protein CO165_04730 [Candidatus Roizmanbacteria bacterium CG_4_9_14_3_um_filter_33_18]|uniref:Uncharacterized protein n=1 Tax=Candidatus Roizmanbacteria bacterium CG_4_9_14_3_um_filter_33_18 TaxID=1974841 RepID=A0A2M7XWV7_9BACT|nr:MAG: hypothetical protein CO165_04730 [Candidatus Roizmanbacteria bacterium CG_4_9_14_3_um_filter_33_18]